MVIGEVTIDTRNMLRSIIKDELILNDDSDFIDVIANDDGSFDSPNNIADIADIIISSDKANVESFVEICNSDAKKSSKNRTIYQVNNHKEVSEYSQLYSNCGITTNGLINQTELCKTTKSFTCSACSLKFCSKNNLDYHMRNDHKIPIICAITPDSQKNEMSKSINNLSNERSAQRLSRIDRKKNIELYCAKCDSISRSTTCRQRETCGLCNNYVIYQCKICKKRYTRLDHLYRHLKNECINIEPQYQCSQCKYKAKRKEHLQKHVKRNHTIKKCGFCSYKAMSKLQLNEHVSLKHKYKYSCSQCGKTYMQLNSFNTHQKNLCGSKPHFECNHCSYSTKDKCNLRRHIKSQHSEIFLFKDLL